MIPLRKIRRKGPGAKGSIDKMPAPSEDSEQFVVVSWLRFNRIRFTHPANGGVRHIATAVRMKRQGQSAGIPDLLIFDPPKHRLECHSTAVEMKRTKGGTVSEAQQDWLLALEERGWLTIIAHGANEAIKALQAAGYGA